MKKLEALIAGFADEVFRIIRTATLEELAELHGAPPPVPRAASKAATSRGSRSSVRASSAALWPPPRGSVLERSVRARRAGLEEAPAAPVAPVGGEITDPERLLRLERLEVDVTPAAPHPEPSPEPPPVSTEKPVSSAPVLLRANEALVRASSAGIVIRRRKGA
jgi:hypothetical protein